MRYDSLLIWLFSSGPGNNPVLRKENKYKPAIDDRNTPRPQRAYIYILLQISITEEIKRGKANK